MTNRDISWIQAAITTLTDSPTVWLSAPELVREIEKKDIKNIRTNYSQSVRTLRAALTLNCRKHSSPFLRCDGDGGIMFALRMRSDSCSNQPLSFQTSKHVSNSRNQRTHRKHSQPLLTTLNDLGQEPLQTPLISSTFLNSPSPAISSKLLMASKSIHSISTRPPETLTVEIDPHMKGTRGPTTPGSDGSSGVCLPSPVFSILGPMKTLHVLSGSSELVDQRPVRQVRKRRAKLSVSDTPLSPLINGYCCEGTPPSSCVSSPAVLHLVTCHSLPSNHFDVTCVRPSTHPPSSSEPWSNSTYDDPCTAQGDRDFSASFFIEPKPLKTRIEIDSDPSMGHVTEHSSSGSDSDSELSDIQLQPRPTAQLLVRRHSQQQQCLASMDFSQLSDSEINEDDDDNEECDMDDVDVEYVEPMSSGCQQYHPDVKRRRKMRRMPSVDRVSKIGGNGVQLEAAGVEAAGKRVDDTQKKNISVLFQPQSALISENMKSILNMEAFTNLSEVEKTQLVKLLPKVDRTGPSSVVKSSLNNSFFSSALREWVDQVALGGFTPEHRAKLRADEKRKNAISKHEGTTWKSKFFEENWGDKMMDGVENTPCSTLFFPHSKPSSNFSQACLKTIFSSYQGEDLESPPPASPLLSTSLPLPTLPSSTTYSQTTSSLTNALLLSPSSPSLKKHPPSPLPPSPSSTPSLSSLSFSLSSTSPAKLSVPLIGQSTPPPPPLPPPKPSVPSQAKHKTQSPTTTTALTKKGVKPLTKNALVQRKNHVANRMLNKVAVVPLQVKSDVASLKKTSGKLLIAAATSARSGSIMSKFSTSKIIEQWRQNNQHGKTNRGGARVEDMAASHFLSRLPSRTPYQTLLIALAKASKSSKATVYARGTSSNHPHTHLLASHSNPLQAKSDPPSTTSHTHSVFHDHFSLLSKPHVPLEFCAPVVSFPIKWPIEVYRTCLCGRQVQKEHSYTNRVKEVGERKNSKADKEKMNLKLSVPRSILRTSDCLCDKVSLVFCSHCNSLYHFGCGASTLCPTCSAP